MPGGGQTNAAAAPYSRWTESSWESTPNRSRPRLAAWAGLDIIGTPRGERAGSATIQLPITIEAALDEKLKEQLMPAVVVFNFIVAAYVIVRAVYPMFVSGRVMSYGTFFTHLLVGAGIGLLGGAITLAVTMRRK